MPPRLALLALLLFLSGLAGGTACAMDMKARPQLAAGVAFDGDGRLLRARVVDGALVVDASSDQGRTWSAPAQVLARPEPVAAEGELRPEIAAANGRVYVAWTSPLPQPYAGNVRFARSLDGGRTFEAPLTVNDNREAITHRFQSMNVAPDGRITMVWIDKREGEAAKRAGGAYRGAALYYATSDDGGASFQPNRRFAAHSCECCRIALATEADGAPVAFWRHVFPDGTRDHALARVSPIAGDALPRATNERWQINACPHHGPDLAVAADGTRHGVWFNQAGGEAGLFYGAWDKQDKPVGAVRRFAEAGAEHPAILANGRRLLVAWKAFDGEKTAVNLIESDDGGKTWSAARAVAATEHASDHPRLVAYRGDAYLSWATLHEGHRLIPLGDGK